jgi:hypothetical protein
LLINLHFFPPLLGQLKLSKVLKAYEAMRTHIK